MPPTVRITYNSSLPAAFDDIQRSIDARFFSPGVNFIHYPTTPAEYAALQALAAQAAHVQPPGPGEDPERVVR
jgi:hypothetical protein